MGLFKREGSDHWQVSFSVDGKRYYRSLKTADKKMAERKWAIISGQLAEGRVFPNERPKKQHTMMEMVDKFLADVSPMQKGSHARNKEIASHIKEFFGDVPLRDVTTSIVSEYKSTRLKAAGKKAETTLSPETVKKELSLLRQIYNYAIGEWDWVKENPVPRVMKSLPQDTPRVRYVLPEEARKLSLSLPRWLKPIAIVACQTGLRRKSLYELKESEIDFTRNRIIIGHTKNGDPIGITMTSIVSDTLQKVIDAKKTAGIVSTFVFCDSDPKRKGLPYSGPRISKAFQRASEAAGIVDLRLHDLRHDFATLMLRKTKNMKAVQHALGHKDGRQTQRYAHLMPDDLESAYREIDNEGTAAVLLAVNAVESSVGSFVGSGQKERVCISANP